ncbi:MAG TPA: hypothetical protein VKJ65_08000, partial [Phycisphaerae bacterium]|nr:hypothetical protein [Phycisphaerae bacterium]
AGLSQLSNLSLKEFIAETREEYISKAAAAAANLNQLAKLRSKLRQLMQYSTLMDAQRFTRNIENAYRSMWKKWSEKN